MKLPWVTRNQLLAALEVSQAQFQVLFKAEMPKYWARVADPARETAGQDALRRVKALEGHFGGVLKEATNAQWKQIALDSLGDFQDIRDRLYEIERRLNQMERDNED